MNCSLRSLFRAHWLSLSLILLLLMAAGCAGAGATKQEAVEGEPAVTPSVIEDIAVTEEEAAVIIGIKGNEPLTYSAIKHQLPLGVVLYFPNTLLEGVEESLTPESELIKDIIVSQPEEQPGLSRIQINLDEDVPYEVNQKENLVYVRFATSPAEPAVAEGTETGAIVKAAEAVGMEGASRPEETQPAGEPAWVNRINFLMMDQGKSRVIVRTFTRSRPVETLQCEDTHV